MKVKVKRVTRKEYDLITHRLGAMAVFIQIPSTVENIAFEGVFTDHLKQVIAVPWPVDRTKDAQKEFAESCCEGGWPVAFIERHKKHNFRVAK